MLIWKILLFSTIMIAKAQAQQPPVSYPKIAGYVAIVHPIVTFSGNKTTTNFSHSYTVGFPVAINIWKNNKFGFSAEFVPFIKADSTGSKMNNFMFHPGLLIALGKGWTFAGRAAFETGGRYGFTPVINKIVKRNKSSAFFIALPFPFRWGNYQPFSFTSAFEFGLSF
jgi:hypothetical protein